MTQLNFMNSEGQVALNVFQFCIMLEFKTLHVHVA